MRVGDWDLGLRPRPLPQPLDSHQLRAHAPPRNSLVLAVGSGRMGSRPSATQSSPLPLNQTPSPLSLQEEPEEVDIRNFLRLESQYYLSN